MNVTIPDFEIHTEPVDMFTGPRPRPSNNSIVGHVSIWFDEMNNWWWFYRSTDGGGMGDHTPTYNETLDKVRDQMAKDIAEWNRRVDAYGSGKDRNSYGNRVIFAEGSLYTIVPDVSHRDCAGYGGRLFKVRLLATGEVIHTRNLWNGGRVPAEFQHQLPDTAEFLPTPAVTFTLGPMTP